MVLIARDGIKKLMNWKASQQIQYVSQYQLYEPFTDIKSWTLLYGPWGASGGHARVIGPTAGSDPRLVLNSKKLDNVVAVFKGKTNAANGQMGICFRVQDNNNYYRTVVSVGSFYLQKSVAGAQSNLSAPVAYGGVGANTYIWIMIIALYNKFWAYTSTDGSNWTIHFNGITDTSYSSGLVGVEGWSASVTTDIDEFFVYDLTPTKSVEWLLQDVAVKSGITTQVFDSLFEDNFANLTKWDTAGAVGTWSVAGNVLTGTGGGSEAILLTTSAYQFDNFTAEFEVNQSSGNNPWFIFRGSDVNNGYYITPQQTGAATYAALYKRVGGTFTLLALGVTRTHLTGTYYKWKVTVNGGWMTLEVDGQVVIAYYDTTFTTGKIGFRTNIPGTMNVKNLRLPQLGQPVPSFTLNPGVSGLEAVTRLAEIQKAKFWMTWDDKLKVRKLSSTDASNYTYSNVQFSNNYNQADVQLNHVVVYGKDSVVGEAWDYTNIAAVGEERYATVTDLTLTTNAACTALAQEVINTSKRSNLRSLITLPNNVGLEKNDVITITDNRTGQSAALYRVNQIAPRYDSTGAIYESTLDLEQRT